MNYRAVKPNPKAPENKTQQVAQMFDSIAPRYDFLNHFLSLGIDKRWRKKALKELAPFAPQHILDIACGTGDFAIASLRLKPQPHKITALDLSQKMLAVARKKAAAHHLTTKIEFVQGNSENLPFENATFDALTVAFGVRNFEDPAAGLAEMARVLKPGKPAVILEFSQPEKFPMRTLYGFYFRGILPFWGRLISRHQSAYSYLPESVYAFPQGEEFLRYMQNAGFEKTTQKRLSFGVASIYFGKKK